MYNWDVVTGVYSIQGFVGCNCGRRCRGALSCLWACVAMYAWDVVTSMCSVRGCGGGIMYAVDGGLCPVSGNVCLGCGHTCV